MKKIISLLPFLAGSLAYAQERTEVSDLVAAEEAFIRMAKETNTRDAFLHFLLPDAVTASPGKGPRNGKEHLESQEPDGGWLSWRPSFSDQASSGDFGYNTGPWEFRRSRTDSHPVAHGQFLSVWNRNPDGEWRVALDMGITHGAPKAHYKLQVSAIPSTPSDVTRAFLRDLEGQLISGIAEAGYEAHAGLLSGEVRFLRPGHEPAVGVSAALRLVGESSIPEYTVYDSDVASTGDMGYAYGKATTGPDAHGRTTVNSYVRIWKKEAGNWKVVADLLSD